MFEACSFLDNAASVCSGGGGAVYVGVTPIAYDDCGNAGRGPSIVFENSTVALVRCEVTGNSATVGGGVFVGVLRPTFPSCQRVGGVWLSIVDSIVSNNSVVVPEVGECGTSSALVPPLLGGGGVAMLTPTSQSPSYTGTAISASTNTLALVRLDRGCHSVTGCG